MPSDPTASFGHRVLYVEDQPVNAMLMSALFERVPDCDLVVADCGRQALRLAAGLQPSLLLLDLRLPDVLGNELLPLLRRVPGCERAPAIAVTAEHDYDIAGTGFVEMWRKPLHLHRVLERVQCLLAQAAVQHGAVQAGFAGTHLAALDYGVCRAIPQRQAFSSTSSGDTT